jgi:hypothetical protein
MAADGAAIAAKVVASKIMVNSVVERKNIPVLPRFDLSAGCIGVFPVVIE